MGALASCREYMAVPREGARDGSAAQPTSSQASQPLLL
jgi:hypothetical protein